MLALPLHLAGDRGIFGNGFKPTALPFEAHPADPTRRPRWRDDRVADPRARAPIGRRWPITSIIRRGSWRCRRATCASVSRGWRASSPFAARGGTGWCPAACTRPRPSRAELARRLPARQRARPRAGGGAAGARLRRGAVPQPRIPRRRVRIDLRARAGALLVRGDEADEAAQPDQARARRGRHRRRAGARPCLPARSVAAPRRDQPGLADDEGRPRAGSAGRRDGRARRSGSAAVRGLRSAGAAAGLHHLRPGVGRAAGRPARSPPAARPTRPRASWS